MIVLDEDGNRIEFPDPLQMTNGEIMHALEKDPAETKSTAYQFGYQLGYKEAQRHFSPDGIVKTDTATLKISGPDYYKRGGIECIEVIKAWDLNFNLGNALKYICRAGLKGPRGDDLTKAVQYLLYEIEGITPNARNH